MNFRPTRAISSEVKTESTLPLQVDGRRRRLHSFTNFGIYFSLMHIALSPLVALLAGILILLMPRLLNFIVAIYLIVIGLAGLLHL